MTPLSASTAAYTAPFFPFNQFPRSGMRKVLEFVRPEDYANLIQTGKMFKWIREETDFRFRRLIREYFPRLARDLDKAVQNYPRPHPHGLYRELYRALRSDDMPLSVNTRSCLSPKCIAIDSVRRMIVSGHFNDPRLYVWAHEGRSLDLRHTLVGHTGQVYSLAMHPSGLLLASGSDDLTVRVWAFKDQTWVCTDTCIYHKSPVIYLEIHPNGQWMMSGSRKEVCIWELQGESWELTSIFSFKDISQFTDLPEIFFEVIGQYLILHEKVSLKRACKAAYQFLQVEAPSKTGILQTRKKRWRSSVKRGF